VLIFLADDRQVRDITFWTLGSLAGARWAQVPVVAVLVGLPAFALCALARPLNALLLGEAEAFHLGTRVEAVKRLAVVLAAIAVAAGVGFTGLIGFVGLVVPHLVRLGFGADHRMVLPGSALLGGALLVLADLAARSLAAPAELPVGVVTALIGAPFFLWLLRHRAAGSTT
jgi:iron complex transport system permease protein